MSDKSIKPGTPFRWFSEAFALCRAHPRVLFGAASLLVLVALLPTLLQLLVEQALQPAPNTRALLQALFSLLALGVFPPAVGGFYRIVHALHEGRPARAGEVFDLFREAPAALRLIVTNLIFVLLSILVIAGLALVFGGQDLLEFLRAAASVKPGASELPPLPDGLLALMCALLIFALLLMTAQGLATAEVALGGRTPWVAVVDAFKIALGNFAAFLLFYLPMGVLCFLVFMILALVAALLGAVLSLANPQLASLLLAPFTLALLMAAYVLLFTFFYHAWRDTLAAGQPRPAEHQIEA